jgi:GntR family transcriptional regulator
MIGGISMSGLAEILLEEGFTVTVHGKGTYVAAGNNAAKAEERRRELETDLENIIQKGKRYGISNEDIRSMFEMIMEDEEEC